MLKEKIVEQLKRKISACEQTVTELEHGNLLATPVSTILPDHTQLKVRTIKALENIGVTTMDDLLRRIEYYDLYEIRGLGNKCAMFLLDALRAKGLDLRG
jgi:DNA-directed RNA polymerase alpha subunit